jgi:hypothetical protein
MGVACNVFVSQTRKAAKTTPDYSGGFRQEVNQKNKAWRLYRLRRSVRGGDFHLYRMF